MLQKNQFSIKTINLIVLFVLLFNFFQVLPVLAADTTGLEDTINVDDKTKALKNNSDISTTIGKTIGVILSLVGVLFFILMIYGGLLWMTARGDEGQVGKAKELIQAAIVGLVIILSAYAITSYLGTSLVSK